MKKIPLFLLPALVMAIPCLLPAGENLLVAPDKMLLVQGQKQPDGMVTPRQNRKNYLYVLRQRIKNISGNTLFNGTVVGNVRAVWVMVLAYDKKKKVFQKGVWLDGKKLLKDKDGKIHFAGNIDCTGLKADETYCYFEAYCFTPAPAKFEKLSLEIQSE